MKELLDFSEEPATPGEEVSKDKRKLSVLLEILPLSLLAFGLFLSYQGSLNWRIYFGLGAVLTAVIFLINNWLLLWQANYGQIEYGLSILSSVYFIICVIAIYLQFFSLEQAVIWSKIGRGLGMLLLALASLGFISRMNKPSYGDFYRRLLARVLVIFAVLIKGLF